MPWQNIIMDKSLGGLGIKVIEIMNKASLMNFWRLLVDKDSLWSKLYKAKYSPTTNILNAKKKHIFCLMALWVWKGMSNLLDEFRKGIKWHIGEGNISFWN